MKKISTRNKRVLLIYTIFVLIIAALFIKINNIESEHQDEIQKIQSEHQDQIAKVELERDTYKGLYEENETAILSTSRDLKSVQAEFTSYKSKIAEAKKKEPALSRGDTYNIKNFNPISAEELNEWINSKCPEDSPFINQADTFIAAANESGLDPKFIFSIAAVESNYGKSKIARDKNNYFGIGSYNFSPYTSSKTFSANMKDAIIEGAKWINDNYSKNDYLSINSMQSGNKIYCQLDNGSPNPRWTKMLVSIMN